MNPIITDAVNATTSRLGEEFAALLSEAFTAGYEAGYAAADSGAQADAENRFLAWVEQGGDERTGL